MSKLLLCRFRKCLTRFNMLLVERSSETSVFRHLPSYAFRSPKFWKYITYEGYLIFKINKIWYRFQKLTTKKKKKMRRRLCLLDNCIWIVCLKFSILKREYLPSSVNVSINSPKILHITKRDFFQLNFVHIDQ